MTVRKDRQKRPPVIKADFPVKVEAPPLKATGNEVAVEEIAITHEGVRPDDDP